MRLPSRKPRDRLDRGRQQVGHQHVEALVEHAAHHQRRRRDERRHLEDVTAATTRSRKNAAAATGSRRRAPGELALAGDGSAPAPRRRRRRRGAMVTGSAWFAISRSPARGADGRRAPRTGRLADGEVAAARQVDRHDLAHAAGIGRQHQHLLAEEHRLVDRVGDEQDRGAGLLPDAAQLLVQPVARDLVERAERLVHQQQRGPAEQRARDRDALAHAARELVRKGLSPSRRGRPA